MPNGRRVEACRGQGGSQGRQGGCKAGQARREAGGETRRAFKRGAIGCRKRPFARPPVSQIPRSLRAQSRARESEAPMTPGWRDRAAVAALPRCGHPRVAADPRGGLGHSASWCSSRIGRCCCARGATGPRRSSAFDTGARRDPRLCRRAGDGTPRDQSYRAATRRVLGGAAASGSRWCAPMYSGVKGFAESVLPPRSSFRQVVAARVSACRESGASAFVTAENVAEVSARTGEQQVCVFVSAAPNPTSGFIVLVPRSQLIELDMSIDAAMKMIVTCGVVLPSAPMPRPPAALPRCKCLDAHPLLRPRR